MATTDETILHLGADLNKDFVLSFREYCRLNDFKQKTLVRRLVEWWLDLGPIEQEHLYRGRLQEALLQNAAERLEANANFEEINEITSLAKARVLARRALQREKRFAKKAQPIFSKLKSKHPLSRQDKINIRTLLSDCEDLLRTKSVAELKDSPKGA